MRNVGEAVQALARLDTLDRKKVRAVFEHRFTVERMAQDYVTIYESLPAVQTDAAHLRRRHGEKVGLQVVA